MSSFPSNLPSQAFDPRVVNVTITLQGKNYVFDNTDPALAIYTTGLEVIGPSMSTCECRIYNLTKTLRNEIMSLGSPLLNRPPTAANFNQPLDTRPILTLSAGRQSTGTKQIFTGNIVTAEMTQPPDIGIVLRALTNYAATLYLLNSPLPNPSTLEAISSAIATQCNLALDYQGPDIQVDNYTFNGTLQSNIIKLNRIGGVHAWVDATKKVLHVKEADKNLKNLNFTLNSASGLVGIPQITEAGVVTRCMFNTALELGGGITIDSVMNPPANGTYGIAQLGYEIATRDQPFWNNLYCVNLAAYVGSFS